MNRLSVARYFLAGSLLANSMPHFVIALTGRRNITPFGRDSSAPINALWGAINFIGGSLLVMSTDRHTGTKASPRAWQLPFLAGSAFWTLFGAVYERRQGRSPDGE